MADDGEMETKEGMSELMASSQFDFTFSYGGNTISAEEMLVRASYPCPDHICLLVSFEITLVF